MSKLVWDKVGERLFETGVDKAVLFVYKDGEYGNGVAWNGVTGVTKSPSGAEATALYADNIKYLNLMSTEELGLTIEAYMSPEEFDECDGSASIGTGVSIGQQMRSVFGFTYRTKIGNDTEGNDHGYKIHLVYGCLASPSERSYATVNDSPEAMTLSWEVSTTPVEVPGFKPTASVEIDSTKCEASKLAAFEEILYGSESEASRLPMPEELITLFKAA